MQSRKGDGALAQSVEQRTENPCVAGSIPAGTTKKNLSASWGFLRLKVFLVYEIINIFMKIISDFINLRGFILLLM